MSGRRALLVVDVQRDFTTGSLAVPQGRRIAAKISAELTNRGIFYGGGIFASRDWHDAPPSTNGGHFALAPAEPNYVTTWPVHCVAGTKGAEYESQLTLPFDTVHIRKGQGAGHYSAVQGYSEREETLVAELISREIEVIDVVGIATDHCVKATVLDLLDEGFDVNVLLDYCAPVNRLTEAHAIVQMDHAGARLS